MRLDCVVGIEQDIEAGQLADGGVDVLGVFGAMCSVIGSSDSGLSTTGGETLPTSLSTALESAVPGGGDGGRTGGSLSRR